MRINERRGLPNDCEQETYEALRPIFKKYKNMKKGHMSKDRIVGIMYAAFMDACKNRDIT